MEFLLTSAGKLTRKTSFPIKVSRIYSCDWHHFPVSSYTHGQYSVVLRYDSDSKLCRDIINGKVMGIPYPNVVFKFPGMKISFTDDSPRSTIGFSYPAEVIKLLHSWGMFPKEPFWPLTTTPELKRLIGEFIKLSRIYPTLTNPGDIIDRICFNILQEIVTSRSETQRKNRTSDIRIQEVELYFQHHYDEKIDMDAVADQFGFSHTSFYQNWKKIYHSTPHRYIEELRLREAAFRLLQSSQPLSVIAEELQFPGSSYFYRKFRKHFHTTPAEFRRNREHWQKVLSESFPEGRPV